MAFPVAPDLPALEVLNQEIVACSRCPRLVDHRETIGRVQRRAYRGQLYWSKPVPAFGDPAARLLIIGLAPGAHGANRTGRMFTGDRSGEFLYHALWETGFANQPESVSLQDGLQLKDAYITAAVRCVPPDNKPAREEILACRGFLVREVGLMKNVQVVMALGALALDAYLAVLQDAGFIQSKAQFRFAHGALYRTHAGGPLVLTSYHPSQQNTSTKRLTRQMLREVFETARRLIEGGVENGLRCAEAVEDKGEGQPD
ncbi:MAG: uracil-DNA glycosylase [Acidobacteriaceae bacterium]|nr:uracil-DNA glycosylase [Acidobacteriaceae bacterium]